LPVFAIILLGGVFFYVKDVVAASANPLGWIGGIAFDGIKSMAFSFIWLIFWIIGKLLAALIIALDTFSRIPVYPKTGVPVVEEIWKIMRDMANMAFIVALVIAAFATIFNTFSSSMAFFKGMNWQQTLVKLLISAVLINFSLTLGVLVLDIAQVPTNMLLRSMGDIAGNLGNGLNPSQFMVGSIGDANGVANLTGVFDKAGGALDATGGALISLIFGIVLLGSFLVCIFTGIAFIIYRIPMIWMLLMFSPLIWVARIFPGGEKSFSDWWSKLIGWAFFLPYYFFFVYLALYLLGNQDRIMKAITLNTNTTVYGPDISVQLIFFYAIVNIILMGGTKMAISWSQSTGAAGKKFFDWTDKAAKRSIPMLGSVESIKKAGTQRFEEIQKKGLPGRFSMLYGGDAAITQRDAYWAKKLGVSGAGPKYQRLLTDKASEEFKLIEEQFDLGKLNTDQVYNLAKNSKATDAKGLAYRKMAAKVGKLDNALFIETLTQLKDNPAAIKDFMSSAKESKFRNISADDIARMAAGADGVTEDGKAFDYSMLRENGNYAPMRRDLYKHLQSDTKNLSKLEDGQIKEALAVFGGDTTADGFAFMKDLGKARPDYGYTYKINTDVKRDEAIKKYNDKHAGGYQIRLGQPLSQDDAKRLKTDHYVGALGELKDIANLPFKKIWDTEEFQAAMVIKYASGSSKSATSSLNNLENLCRAVTDSGDKIRILDLIRQRVDAKRNSIGSANEYPDPGRGLENQMPGGQQEEDEPEEDMIDDTDANQGGDTPLTASGVSARNQKPRIITADLNQNNVIDLRDKEK